MMVAGMVLLILHKMRVAAAPRVDNAPQPQPLVHQQQPAQAAAAEQPARQPNEDVARIEAAVAAAVAARGAGAARAFAPAAAPTDAAPDAAPLPTASPNIPEGEALPLRFLYGERPALTYTVNRRMPIRQLKLELVPLLRLQPHSGAVVAATSSSSAELAATAQRISLIVQGQTLRDDSCLADSALEANDVVHVHVLPLPQDEQAEAAAAAVPAAQQQPVPQQRVWHQYPGQAVAPVGVVRPQLHPLLGGQILLPPRRLGAAVGGGGMAFGAQVQFGGAGAQAVVMLPADLLNRTIQVLLVAACGALWGVVLVCGSSLLSESSFLLLVALTGFVCVSIARAADNRQPVR